MLCVLRVMFERPAMGSANATEPDIKMGGMGWVSWSTGSTYRHCCSRADISILARRRELSGQTGFCDHEDLVRLSGGQIESLCRGATHTMLLVSVQSDPTRVRTAILRI